METLKRKGGVMMAQISKDMTFGQLLEQYYEKCPQVVEVLMEAGMGCIGCPHSQMESIEEGAIGHGIDPDLLVEKLNATVNAALKA
jgi:hybrid cluster-associated redox disulfide protein